MMFALLSVVVLFLLPTTILFLTLPTAVQSMSVSVKSTSKHTLGAPTLRRIVTTASAECDDDHDLKGILWLEHLNLVVGDQTQAEQFYLDFLGLTRDPDAKFHCNLGQQQFHLAAAASQAAQRVTGSIGLTVPSLATVRARIPAAQQVLEGTQFRVVHDDDATDRCLTVVCPWGNTIHVYGVDDDAYLAPSTPTKEASEKMVRLHGPGGAYGAHRMSVRGQPGIRYVELACPVDSAPAIAAFYRTILSCDVQVVEHGATVAAVVTVGPGVHLLFVETDSATIDSDAMQGVHLCIYTGPGFRALYDKLTEYELIWTNPRFVHLDRCDTWEEAAASRTLRFKDIIDLSSTKTKLLELEHETRPMRHGQFMKVPKYIPK